MQARQGDLLIEKVTKVPTDAIRDESDVIHTGEATGHTHRLVGGQIYRKGDTSYLSVGKDASVTHDEHAAVDLDEGVHKVTRQREYSPAGNRMVSD